MYQLLYKYLILNKKVGIPGVGNFSIEEVPASMDFVSKQIAPPKEVINFTSEEVHADRSFYNFLQKELNLTEVDAIKATSNFAHKVKEGIANGGVTMPGIGTLKTGYNGDHYFVSETKYNNYLPDIRLQSSLSTSIKATDVYDTGETRIITQDAETHDMEKIALKEKEDYWWVYAIVLALMGLGALLYYYI